ncbi:MAG: hypothetical protein BWY12_00608 [candidate division BRC1 bacterium ADurb.Bin183]|nr:MAG: hypothetical protein BWY12_00608 [candidate division BRC1 bacterium ADurb.Bin183]
MKKGLILTLATVAVALLSTVGYGYAPIIGNIPDVIIGDVDDPIGSTEDLYFFRFTNAFNFDDYVSKHPNDEDQSTTNVRWSFLASDPGLLLINGIETLNDPTEAINPGPKELTQFPNDNKPFPRDSSLATFRDIKDSPLPDDPPYTPAEPLLDTIITIYASNGAKATSKSIAVKAEHGGIDRLSTPVGGWTLIRSYVGQPDSVGWTSGYAPLPGGTWIDAFDGSFYIAAPVTGSGFLARIDGRSGTLSQTGSFVCPKTDMPYEPNQLYRLTYKLRTSQNDPAKVPTTRMLVFVGDSAGNSAIAGGNRIGKSGPYTLGTTAKDVNVYFGPPDCSADATVTNLWSTFEVIDFDVAEEGSVYLDQLDVAKMATPDISGGTLVKKIGDGQPWTGWASTSLTQAGGAAFFGPVTFTSGAAGLSIASPGPAGTGAYAGHINWGQWSAREGAAVSFEASKLYRFVYKITGVPLGGAVTKVPQIRVINNNIIGTWAAKLVIDPVAKTVAMPTPAGKEYSVWLETFPTLFADPANNFLTFLFDVADGADNQGGTSTLNKVEVYTYDIP